MSRLMITLLVLAFWSLTTIAFPVEEHPDKLIATKAITGHLVSFDQNDYHHVTVRSHDGKEESFFLGGEACFLAEHLKETLEIKYDEVERYFPEGDGYYPANFIRKITAQESKKNWDGSKDTKQRILKEVKPCLQVLEQLDPDK